MTPAALPPQTAAQQILDELAADPALAAEFWKLIADQPIKALPQTVAELDQYIRETLIQVAAQQAQTEKTLADLTRKQEGTRALLDKFIAEQRALNAQFREETKNTRALLDKFIAEQRALNAQFREEMKANYDRQEILNAEHRENIKAIQDNLAQLNGSDAERHAENNIAGLLRRHDSSLREVRILKSNHLGSDEATSDAIAEALDEGKISPEEYEQLMALDLLARARPRRQEEPFYYAIEISRTIYPDDLGRAQDRAQILAKALSLPTQPLVIGHAIAEQYRRMAEKLEVPCITYSRLKN